MKSIYNFVYKLYKKLPVIAFDVLAIPTAWYLAYWLRYNLQPFPSNLTSTYSIFSLLLLTAIQVSCYYYFRVYRGLWRFSSLKDVTRIINATLCATVLTVLTLYFASLLGHLPRSVLPLYDIILVTLLCGGRLTLRLYWDWKEKDKSNERKRVLIIGAGRAGDSLVRDLKRIQMYLPIGFVDDNPHKRGLELHGVRVLGTTRDLADLVINFNIDLIFIAIPSARSATMRRIVNYCEASKVPFRTLPGLSALVAGRVEVNALRDVNIEDLLGRDQVQLEWEKIASKIMGKSVVVTGGGGSIGSELCRQIMLLRPAKLLIIDNSEFNLYKIELELKQKFSDIPLQLGLVSVTDSTAIDFLFHEFKPQIVFHAAAYKHVPMLEEQVRVAVQNNVIGTQVVAEASVAVGVEKFILISTDKAVNPTNIMGTTKRIAEIYCQNLNERVATQFITVRFGNVLGSAGSVVPLFQKQLQVGGPLTVTHPDIQRYFMTIPEACQLILQAMVNGLGGEIFVLDMGEPIKISYLAEQMIRLAGKEPGKDIQISYTGLRPGEKLFEELFHPSEELSQTEHEKLFKAKFRHLEWNELMQTVRMLNMACAMHNNSELYILLKSLVPEFNSEIAKESLTNVIQ
ncbi:polysaccharide biosynthesis protein [Legionella jordanis]|uniref:Nucleoside-diphosphate sugar epimerase n=1 Tax=Legionella jordanis TaxID=456 RepID=A0A0W0V870_9GAMM|nr:nucleoside-diphosphate sugar epimerase/dehydratase [Legionella jordanis]KTD16323.1 nucleoside-diphosphate sugar epimerase [Legionella jordanis]RMX04464.1 polysaccharide biosynthesis protein [Legionella jordanis]RMX21009.1 polysaccharide biosynthesis protein [Legionella jordanis]VEH12219.1 nucleoside-diphosphate sugar epimerase [Legionella jordanis]HAT8713429.1 NAD-dependent epimerase/dehydratase family protein [Legionella jordanis]